MLAIVVGILFFGVVLFLLVVVYSRIIWLGDLLGQTNVLLNAKSPNNLMLELDYYEVYCYLSFSVDNTLFNAQYSGFVSPVIMSCIPPSTTNNDIRTNIIPIQTHYSL